MTICGRQIVTVIEQAVQWAIDIAADNSHGYSQAGRWGPDYDCSSFVISAYEQAGLSVKEAGASYTGNMYGAFLACGFEDVTAKIGLATGAGVQAGDVLLNHAAHTCLSVGSGRVANCRTDEGHPQTGDQSGNEIRIQAYWNYPWDCVLRYAGATSSDGHESAGQSTGVQTSNPSGPRSVLRKGMTGEDVRILQKRLAAAGYDPGEADGVYGYRTFRAVVLFQEDHGLDVDGVAGPMTMSALAGSSDDGHQDHDQPPAAGPVSGADARALDLPNLTTGDSGDAVTFLQAALNLLGYSSGRVDGAFGPMTAAALNRFKQAKGLPTDSTADGDTWDFLLARR